MKFLKWFLGLFKKKVVIEPPLIEPVPPLIEPVEQPDIIERDKIEVMPEPALKPTQTFYDKIRPLFGGKLTAGQVQGMEAIIAEFGKRKLSDLRWLAYALATAFHETGKAMQPIEENLRYSAQGLANNWLHRYALSPNVTPKIPNALAKKLSGNPVAIANNAYANRIGNGNEASGDGWKYRGRGLPQTTGKANYQWAKALTGIDFVSNPDLMLSMEPSVKTMFEGMILGRYTGKKFADYFTNTVTDWVGARRIINGLDKAQLIADYAKRFHSALS
jgi:putative chitinase